MSEYNFIKIRKEEGVAILTLSNPPVNAINPQMIDELDRALDELAKDEEVKALIITGEGTYAFSAGADVKALQGLDKESASALIKKGQSVFTKLEKFPKPTIAAINGLALGGGNELAMACDIRISSDRARFGNPEVQLGLIPAWGGTQRLARLVGKGRALELIYTGRYISAQEALRIGLVNRVVPDGEELRAAMDLARMIMAKSAPLAVQAAKKAVLEGLEKGSIEEALKVEYKYMMELVETEDLREGITAFLEKRPPQFKGK